MSASFTRHVFRVPGNLTLDERRTGPSQKKVRDAYAGAIPGGDIRVDNGIQIWTVPLTGTYRITAKGAQGGTGPRSGSGGYGAMTRGDFMLEQGSELHVLVGHEGRRNEVMVGGGGGSFVFTGYDATEPLLAAGGGGAYGVGNASTHVDRAHANTDPSGKAGFGNPHGSTQNVPGGTGGNGGAAARTRGCGGGGWSGEGESARGGNNSGGGFSVLPGGFGRGGEGGGFQDGAFGAGGAVNKESTSWGACGGGGGYSGGGGAYSTDEAGEAAGGGGGSYVHADAKNVRKSGGFVGGNRGDGSVEVRFIPDVSDLGGGVAHDERKVLDKIADVTANESGDQGDIVADRLVRQRQLEAQRNVGETQEEVKTAAEAAGLEYREVAAMLGTLNESSNANTYISDNVPHELARVTRLNQQAHNEVAKTQQRRLMLDHGIHTTRFLTDVLVFTMFVAGLVFFPIGGYVQDVLPQAVFWFLIVLVLGGYAIAMTVMFTANSRRRQTHWKQRYEPGSARLKKQVCKFKREQPIVSLFTRCGYKGRRHDVKAPGAYDGDYLQRHLGRGENARAIGVRNGYAVRLYLRPDLTRESQTLVRNAECVLDHVQSLEIVAIRQARTPLPAPADARSEEWIQRDEVKLAERSLGTFRTSTFYRLSFDVKPLGRVGNWGSILRFSEKPYENYPRLPGIWFTPGDLRLHVKQSTRRRANVGPSATRPLALGQWNSVVVELSRTHREASAAGTLRVWINGDLVAENEDRGAGRDDGPYPGGLRHLYMGTRQRKYDIANALVRNVKYTHLPAGLSGEGTATTDVVKGLGRSRDDPARSGRDVVVKYRTTGTPIALDRGGAWFWIQSPRMPDPQLMWVDFEQDGGGYDFLAIHDGFSGTRVDDDHSGRKLGLDIFYPRSRGFWVALKNFVLNVVGAQYMRDYLGTAGAVYRDTETYGNGGNYTWVPMRDPRYFGRGAPDWKVPDGGPWWIRDTPYSEPNGNYPMRGYLMCPWRNWNDNGQWPDRITIDDQGGVSPGKKFVLSTNTHVPPV